MKPHIFGSVIICDVLILNCCISPTEVNNFQIAKILVLHSEKRNSVSLRSAENPSFTF